MQGFTKTRSVCRELREHIEWPGITDCLHTARTLDETYYPSLADNILRARNKQQVVTRECAQLLNGASVTDDDKPILIVPQLWIWRSDNLVVSAYSPPGNLPKEQAEYEPLEPPRMVVEQVDEYRYGGFDIGDEERCLDYTIRLIADQITKFGGVQANGKYQSPLDYFEVGVVRILSEVNQYTKSDGINARVDVQMEATFISDIADIRDELAMIDDVLRQQDGVLETLALHELRPDERGMSKPPPPDRLRTARGQIKRYRDRVAKIDKDAERIDKAIGDLLNLKRTEASMRDAAASGRDARTSLLLGVAVIGFTVITVIFAPLAFMTALFALNIDELVKHKSGNGDDAVYPSWYIFVTFGKCLPCHTPCGL